MRTVNVDAPLLTMRGAKIMFDDSTQATFALVVESAIQSDDQIDGVSKKLMAKRVIAKCVMGGEQTFNDDEVELILSSCDRAYKPIIFFAVDEVLSQDGKP